MDLDGLSGLAHEVFELPDLIRGYESIKLENIVLFRERSEAIFSSIENALAAIAR
jgi:hypothetical protein